MVPSSAVVNTCDERDVCIPSDEAGAARFLVKGVLAIACVESKADAVSTDPSHETRTSRSSSCLISGKSDSSIASLISVESSGCGDSWFKLDSSPELDSRRRFLETKPSIIL